MKTGRAMTLTLCATLLYSAAAAETNLGANVGFASDYYYRGIFQASSSASAGLDLSHDGFYAGVWTADVKQGLEVDAYFGYGTEIGGVDIGVGFTGYYYTQDFDDTYEEINLSTGFGPATIELALGQYDNFGAGKQYYTFSAVTLEKNGWYGKAAMFANDFDGEYLELGYANELAGFDLGVALILASDDLVGEADEALAFTVGKSFKIH